MSNHSNSSYAGLSPSHRGRAMVDAVNAQNVETSKLTQQQIDQQDVDWLNRSDRKGLNGGGTDLMTDYMRGDEAKFWKTCGAGPNAVFVDKVEPDAGLAHICQVSLTIKDPKTGKAIGGMTVGINTDKLK